MQMSCRICHEHQHEVQHAKLGFTCLLVCPLAYLSGYLSEVEHGVKSCGCSHQNVELLDLGAQASALPSSPECASASSQAFPAAFRKHNLKTGDRKNWILLGMKLQYLSAPSPFVEVQQLVNRDSPLG